MEEDRIAVIPKSADDYIGGLNVVYVCVRVICVTVACVDVWSETGLVAAATQFALAATFRRVGAAVRQPKYLFWDAARASPLVAARVEVVIAAA